MQQSGLEKIVYRATIASFILFIALALRPASAMAASVTINSNSLQQKIDGFGACITEYNDAQLAAKPNVIKLLFSPDSGIGLSLIRIALRGVDNSKPDSAGPQASQVACVKAAMQLSSDIKVWAASWSPPASYKTNNSIDNGGSLLASYYQKFAGTLTYYIKQWKSQGIDIYGISPQNEPNISTGYPSCIWDGNQLRDFIRDYLKPTLIAQSLSTKIIMPEWASWSESAALPALNDANACAAVDIIAAHSYDNGYAAFTNALAKGKTVWQTETYSSEYTGRLWGTDLVIGEPLGCATSIHNQLVTANMSGWHLWNFYGDSDGNVYPYYIIGSTIYKRYYFIGNYSKFVRPGYSRVDVSSSNPQSGVLVSAYKDNASSRIVVVVINQNTSTVPLTVTMPSFQTAAVTPWVSSATDNLAKKTDIAVSNNAFAATLGAQSITTFVGKASSVISIAMPERGQGIQGATPNPFRLPELLTLVKQNGWKVYDLTGNPVEVSRLPETGVYYLQAGQQELRKIMIIR